jgi:hypothetical protein
MLCLELRAKTSMFFWFLVFGFWFLVFGFFFFFFFFLFFYRHSIRSSSMFEREFRNCFFAIRCIFCSFTPRWPFFFFFFFFFFLFFLFLSVCFFVEGLCTLAADGNAYATRVATLSVFVCFKKRKILRG